MVGTKSPSLIPLTSWKLANTHQEAPWASQQVGRQPFTHPIPGKPQPRVLPCGFFFPQSLAFRRKYLTALRAGGEAAPPNAGVP